MEETKKNIVDFVKENGKVAGVIGAVAGAAVIGIIALFMKGKNPVIEDYIDEIPFEVEEENEE